MVKRMQAGLVDDVDGSPAEVTVSLRLDGVTYELNLSRLNAERMRSDLRPWIAHARRTRTRQRASGPARVDKLQLAKMRQWARDNGWSVSTRGRLPADVLRAFSEAHA